MRNHDCCTRTIYVLLVEDEETNNCLKSINDAYNWIRNWTPQLYSNFLYIVHMNTENLQILQCHWFWYQDKTTYRTEHKSDKEEIHGCLNPSDKNKWKTSESCLKVDNQFCKNWMPPSINKFTNLQWLDQLLWLWYMNGGTNLICTIYGMLRNVNLYNTKQVLNQRFRITQLCFLDYTSQRFHASLFFNWADKRVGEGDQQ